MLVVALGLLPGCAGHKKPSPSTVRVQSVQQLLADLSVATVAADAAAVASGWQDPLQDDVRRRIATSLESYGWTTLTLELIGLRQQQGGLFAQVRWQGKQRQSTDGQPAQRSGQVLLELSDTRPPRIRALSGEDPFAWVPTASAVTLQ